PGPGPGRAAGARGPGRAARGARPGAGGRLAARAARADAQHGQGVRPPARRLQRRGARARRRRAPAGPACRGPGGRGRALPCVPRGVLCERRGAAGTLPRHVSEAVGLFYDDMDRFYEAVWGGNLHAGLWTGPADRSSLAEAQDRLTDLFVERVGVGAGQILLDVGCGTGAPALRAARALGCRAVGLTVSGAQVFRARDLARGAGLAQRVDFLMADAGALPFGDAGFDGAWALESIFHVADRRAALREMRRVLRPGGRVVLTDLVENRPLDA